MSDAGYEGRLESEIARLRAALNRIRRAVANDKLKSEIDDIARRALAEKEGK
jgi:hypothetical protein